MRHKLIAFALLAVATASCTSVKYRSPQFSAKTVTHQQIAVLPFEMVLTGKLPDGLSPAMVVEIEERESLGFQQAFHDALLNQSGDRKRPILITLQPVTRTNRILAENGISIRESWDMTPEELARVLGVHAVIRTRVTKARYLSDGASAGIDLGTRVLDQVTEGRLRAVLPWGLARTHDIFADGSLLDGSDGTLLWKVGLERHADWACPANEVIVGVTRKLAKQFPYRV
jgi:hypothetical protein